MSFDETIGSDPTSANSMSSNESSYNSSYVLAGTKQNGTHRSGPRTESAGNVVTALPMVSIETIGPRETNVSKAAKFQITVTNLGDTLAEDVVVEAILPEHAKLVRSNPVAEAAGEKRIRFPVADLETGAKKTFHVELMPQSGGHIDLETRVSFATKSEIRTQVLQPKLELAYQGPREAETGKKVAFRLIITNTGDGMAEDVSVAQVTPDGEAGRETASSQVTIEQLRPGESRELPNSFLAGKPGTMQLKFTATAAGDVRADCAAEILVRSPKLRLEIRGPKVTYLRRHANYVLALSNTGDAAAENVRVTVSLPPGLQTAVADAAAAVDGNRNSLEWSVPQLGTGAEQQFTFRAEAVQEGEQALQVQTHWNACEPRTTEHLTEVVSRPDLTLNLDYNDGQIELGDTEAFEIMVKNRGTNVARNVAVRVTLPSGLEGVESSNYATTGAELRYPAFSLPAGEQKQFRFRASGRVPGDHIVQVHLRADEAPREVLREESIFCFES